MKFNLLCLIAMLGTSLLISACATIMNGDMVNVPVYTNPTNAKLTINGMQYTTPTTIQVPRGEGNFILHIEKDEYIPVDIMLVQSCDAWLWGNVLLGGLIGVGVDFISGDAYNLEPESVFQELQKEIKQPVAQLTP